MAKTLNELYYDLTTKVYLDDMDSQRHYLSVVEDSRGISVDYLIRRGCLFIPNNEYIRYYLGKDANTFGVELYREERCLWTLFVLIPILDLSGEVVGLVGWDAEHKRQELEEGVLGLPMYKVSSKAVFSRERFFLSDVDLLKATFDTRRLFIVDGVFDSVTLNYRGLPAISLLGSTVSREVLYFLRWYESVYVICDNDSAGQFLYRKLRSALSNVYRVVQNKTKDIEELLRADGFDGLVSKQLHHIIKEGPKQDIQLVLK